MAKKKRQLKEVAALLGLFSDILERAETLFGWARFDLIRLFSISNILSDNDVEGMEEIRTMIDELHDGLEPFVQKFDDLKYTNRIRQIRAEKEERQGT